MIHHIEMVHTTQIVPFLLFPFCSTLAASTTQCVTKNLILTKHSLLSVFHTKPRPTVSYLWAWHH